jgi:hypothetical protein
MNAPSTTWRETPTIDEAARHKADTARLVALQQERSKIDGQGRALHRKQVIALRATLRVLEGLPAHARHGLFAMPGAHDTWVRLSNGGSHLKADREPDIRGFALRVGGVQGPSALGGSTDEQDFLLINHSAFAFADSRPFVGLVEAAPGGLPALLGWALRSFGPLGMWKPLAHMAQVQRKPFSGYASETFFSGAPLACGPYAVRVRLLPPPGQQAAASQTTTWAEDLAARLKGGPLVWRLQLQFFVDEALTPIENAAVDWPESVSPYVTVADLVVEPQDLSSPATSPVAQAVEASAFDPWHALAAHRPLGEVMRARKVAYFASAQARGAAEPAAAAMGKSAA